MIEGQNLERALHIRKRQRNRGHDERIMLDVLKPHDPSNVKRALQLARQTGVDGVTVVGKMLIQDSPTPQDRFTSADQGHLAHD